MSMFWIIILLILIVWTSGKSNYKRNRNLQLISRGVHSTVNSWLGSLRSYNSTQLKEIYHDLRQNNRRMIPDFDTIRKVKGLKINKRRIRLSNGYKHDYRKSNLENLIDIQKDPELPDLSCRNIKIGNVNARSVRGKSELIFELLFKEDLDLLLVTESWLKNKDRDNIWLESQEFSKGSYTSVNVPRRGQKRGGGMLLISKRTIKCKLLEIVKHDLYEGAIWKVMTGSKELTLFAIYHPPQPTGSNGPFIDHILDKTSSLLKDFQNIIVMGDFNIQVNDFTDADATYLLDAMSALNLTQMVNKSTHRQGNILDLLFISEDSQINITQLKVTDMLSDHKFVLAQLNVGKPKIKRQEMLVRKIDDSLFKDANQDFNDSKILSQETLEDCLQCFNAESSRIMDKYFPIKAVKPTNKMRVPWFNKTSRDQRKIVRNRERCWLKYSDDHHWTAYKRERNRYLNIIKYNKKQVYSGQIQNVKGDVKKLYQVMHGLSGQCTREEFPPGSDDTLIEEFADFFLHKIEKIRDQFGNFPIYEPLERDIPKLRRFRPLTKAETMSLIYSMKAKSCELDILPTRILKEILPSCIDSIVKIINLSLESGFAREWKTAIVRPLLKKLGADLIYKNFRPVSNLSFLSKLVEKAVLKQFLEHCDTYKLHANHQSAYRENHSCETAILKLVNDVLWSMENQSCMACIFMDLSAAFDTVDHELLLNILSKEYGISDNALQWYDTYLRPRDYKVCIHGKYSKPRELNFSVPQGSASGANIFTAYCASIKQVIPDKISLQGFADDHFIFKSFVPKIEEKQTLQELEYSMKSVQIWMSSMRLKLNTDKTEYIKFGNQKQLEKTIINEFNAGSDIVECKSVVKCLGAYLDKNLNFKEHVKNKAKVAMTNLMKIRNIRKFLTKEACETLVTGLVISHLDYANNILLKIPESTIQPFVRVQNLAAKIILNRSKFTSTTEALSELNWVPIRMRSIYKILTIMHKITHGNSPDYLSNLLTLRPTGGRLRSQQKEFVYIIPRVKHKTFAYRSISVQGPELWNSLPTTIRSQTNFELFKKQLKTWILSNL